MKERWLPVCGWEGLYEVSNFGRVRSVDRTIEVLNPFGVLGKRRFRGRILRPGIGKKGYPHVNFTAPSRKRECRNVHDLVALHFIGPRPDGLEVCHRNGVRADCRESNLRWGSRSSNALDRHEHGTMNLAKGEEHFYAKLTESDVRWVRENAGEMSQRAMAEVLGVTHGTIGCAVRRKCWKHVD